MNYPVSVRLRIKGLSRGRENINGLFQVNKATGHSFNIYYTAQQDSLHTLCLVYTLITYSPLYNINSYSVNNVSIYSVI